MFAFNSIVMKLICYNQPVMTSLENEMELMVPSYSGVKLIILMGCQIRRCIKLQLASNLKFLRALMSSHYIQNFETIQHMNISVRVIIGKRSEKYACMGAQKQHEKSK